MPTPSISMQAPAPIERVCAVGSSPSEDGHSESSQVDGSPSHAASSLELFEVDIAPLGSSRSRIGFLKDVGLAQS